MSKELEQAKHAKKGLQHINHHKVFKRAEFLDNIERIKSEKQITDTESMEQKYTSEAVMTRLERNLEIELDIEQLQCRQANATIK